MKARSLAWLWLTPLLLVACGGAPAPSPAPPPLPTATDYAALEGRGELPPPVAVTDQEVAGENAIQSTPESSTPEVVPVPPTPPVLAAEETPVNALPRIGPGDVPAGVNPLTGLAAGPETLAHRPMAVKISNSGPIVRPQSGLNSADWVFEHLAEGGITRFTAVFYGQSAPLIGPIRSARLIDLEIPKMADAAFAYSGSSGPVRELIRSSPFFDRVISPDFGHAGFWRDASIGNPAKPSWETMYTDSATLRFQLEQRGLDVPPALPANLAFSAEVPAGGTPASTIEIQYPATNVFWRHDPTTGLYGRWADGQPHLDANSGAQISFRNVVAVGANHVESQILEDEVGGGHYGYEIQLWGEGPASIFRDGQRFEGTWVRRDPGDMIVFYDSTGQLLPLAPGNTFFQLVPLGFSNLSTTP